MNKRLNIIAVFAYILCMGFVSCQKQEVGGQDEFNIPEGFGALNFTPNVSSDVSVIPLNGTRAFDDISVDDFYVSIKDQNGNSDQIEYTTFYELKEEGLPLLLEEGEYEILASSKKRGDAKVSTEPYFEGTENVFISSGSVTNVSLRCVLKCIGVEVQIGEQLRASLTNSPTDYAYKVTVSNGKGGECVFHEEQPSEGEAIKDVAPKYLLDECEEYLIVKVLVRLGDQSKWYPERVWRFKNNNKVGSEVEGDIPGFGEYYIIHLDAGKEEPSEPEMPEETTLDTQSLRCTMEEMSL